MSMTKKMMVVTGLCVAICLLLSSVAYSEAPKEAPAPEKPKPVEVKLEGTVSVVRDANDNITSVKLTTTLKGVYEVMLNTTGLELGKTMDGKKVEVEGIVSHKDGEKLVDVKSFKPVAEKPAEKPKE
jgi:hypothetical protein